MASRRQPDDAPDLLLTEQTCDLNIIVVERFQERMSRRCLQERQYIPRNAKFPQRRLGFDIGLEKEDNGFGVLLHQNDVR